jgi:hypothetical protein
VTKEGKNRAAPAEQTAHSYTSAQEAVVSTYDIVPQAALVPLRFQRVALIPLGNSPADSPAAIGSVRVTDSAVVVIDPASRRLRFFSRAGALRAAVPFDSAGLTRHTAPTQVESLGDTVFVVDLDMRRGIVAYDVRGRRVTRISTPLPATTDVAPIGEQRIVSVMPKEEDVTGRRAAVLWRLAANGATAPLGCIPDSLLRSSMQKRTSYSTYRFTGVATDGRRLYCRQALSPVIQIFLADGTPDGMLHRAPPFYRRGPGVSLRGLDDAGMEAFRATWTEHGRFFPMPSGFVSLYGTFDPKARLDRQLLFACDSSAGSTKCGVSELKGNPMDFRAPDTLIVAEPAESAQAVQRLGLYVVRL